MLRPKSFPIFPAVFLLLLTVGFGQDKAKIKQLKPTWRGSTGLFNVYLADTLRRGEFSLGFHNLKFHREPGDIDITLFPVSFTLGLHDRVEIFGSWEAHRRVNADAIIVNRVRPGEPPRPSQVANSSSQIAWYNDTPFMDVGFGDGTGHIWAGIKVNLLSERFDDPFGLAVQGIGSFHTKDEREHRLRGLTPGVSDYGFDLIFSKNLPAGSTFGANAGIMWAEDVAAGVVPIDRQNRFNWGLGLDAPLGSNKAHFIGELVGSTFWGDRSPGIANPRSPVDVYAGLRWFPARWVMVGGAYNLNLRTIDEDTWGIPGTDRHGWFAQLEFERKINEPPTVECVADKTTVTEGESVTVRVNVTDPDDDVHTITWRTTGGRLTQQDNSATLDTTGLAPGRYTVTAEVSDGEATATCSVDVTVEKRKMAPTIVCEPEVARVTEGESVTLSARASDPNNDPLTYSWTVNGQSVPNNQPEFVFGTAGRAPGEYRVRATVTDVDGMSASCEFRVTVERRPNRPPTVTLTLDKTEVIGCDTVTATADARDPDNDPLTYEWSVDGQRRSETGRQIQINACELAAGRHSVTVTVRDGRGGEARDTKSFAKREKIVIQMVKLDNVAKARLDEIALRMQQSPRLKAIITGHTDDRGSEQANMRRAQERADSAKDYLVKQHNIDASRIETRSAGESQPIADNTTAEGRKQNNRIEIELFEE